MAKLLSDILPTFERLIKKPEDYISAQDKIASDVTELLKILYDFTKAEENGLNCGDALPELIVQGFDQEQIWQELELQNCGRSTSFVADVASLVARRDRLALPAEADVDNIVQLSPDDNSDISDKGKRWDEEDDDDYQEGDFDEFEDEKKPEKRKGRIRVSEVDDKFFKLSEMEEFLEQEEKQDASQHDSSDESIDLFRTSDLEEDEEEEDVGSDNDIHYADFFDAPQEDEKEDKKRKKKRMKNEEAEEEEEQKNDEDEEEMSRKKVRFNISDEQTAVKSSLEMRQERLQARIEQLEEQALAEKPWQLKGEISASSRPQNSLLEEILEFDLSTRPAPVITEKTTLQLEDIIKQRMKDRVWDDVERKVKPVETPNEYKKKLVLDQEKSKLSLAQVYEQEYVKQREAQQADDTESQPQAEPQEHLEVRAMMNSLFAKLDALSNFHYTPRPPAPEVKIVSNLPAISLEEVAPVTTSDATLLAPEEVKARPKGDLIGKAERTKTDKKRDRRKKKIRQRERQREREKREQAVEKLRPGLGNKYSKERALRDLESVTKKSNVFKMDEKDNTKSVQSSTAFFSRLQDEVKSHIKKKTAVNNTAQSHSALSAKKLKL